MTGNISDKDKRDWQNFISSKEKLHNKDKNFQKKKFLNIRSIDLHGYTLEEANKSIENFIIKSFKEKIQKLIGKPCIFYQKRIKIQKITRNITNNCQSYVWRPFSSKNLLIILIK